MSRDTHDHQKQAWPWFLQVPRENLTTLLFSVQEQRIVFFNVEEQFES